MQLMLAAAMMLLLTNPPAMMTLSSDGATVTLAWDANTDQVDGYRIYWGTAPRSYQSHYDVGNVTNFAVPRMFGPGQYFFAATAYLGAAESGYSNEVSMAVLPAPPPASPQITMIVASSILTTQAVIAWTTDVDCSGTAFYGTNPARLLAVVSNNLGTTDHLVTFGPLTSRTHYVYKVQSVCSGVTITSPIHSFNTK
jgi:hypothetical protein